ncbi:MAG: hypothetical protein MST10_08630 [Lentisphaeria bacterium]|nr:hypothetical protein [Lentisphaeria bacterium]
MLSIKQVKYSDSEIVPASVSLTDAGADDLDFAATCEKLLIGDDFDLTVAERAILNDEIFSFSEDVSTFYFSATRPLDITSFSSLLLDFECSNLHFAISGILSDGKIFGWLDAGRYSENISLTVSTAVVEYLQHITICSAVWGAKRTMKLSYILDPARKYGYGAVDFCKNIAASGRLLCIKQLQFRL